MVVLTSAHLINGEFANEYLFGAFEGTAYQQSIVTSHDTCPWWLTYEMLKFHGELSLAPSFYEAGR
jgi:hypothetical protein